MLYPQAGGPADGPSGSGESGPGCGFAELLLIATVIVILVTCIAIAMTLNAPGGAGL